MTRRLGSSRRARRWAPVVALAAGAWLLAPGARAQEKKTAPATAPAEAATPAAVAPVDPELIEPAAKDAVKRMVETLTGAQRMSYDYEYSYDSLQDDGEILEFGRHGKTTIRRPDRLRGELWGRDGRHILYAWNGKEIVIYDQTANVFASTARTGDIDGLVDFLRDDVGFRMPVADLFTMDLRALLVDNVVAARYVGKETIGGVETEHVALRMRTGVDVQLWIRTGKEAVPERLVLNFSTADGRPQFRADLSDWDLDPRARDSMFEMKAPKGARKVPFALPPSRRTGGKVEEEMR